MDEERVVLVVEDFMMARHLEPFHWRRRKSESISLWEIGLLTSW